MDINKEYLDLSHEYKILVPITDESEDNLLRGDIYDSGEISSDYLKMVFTKKTIYS